MSFFRSFSFQLPWERTCKLATELAKIGVVIEDIPADELDTTLDALKNDPEVNYIENLGEVQASDLIPNDPGFSNQNDMVQIRAPEGWEYATGSTDVSIAIIDSGVDPNHPELKTKLEGGCNFMDENADTSDGNGHGTHVAGIAAAPGGDGVGIAGVSWGARILPVKVLDENGSGNYAAVAAGIIWAADHGAQIINLSLGGEEGNRTLKAAVDYAVNQGALVVAATGNDGYSHIRYPAAYEEVVAVGSVDAANRRSNFSDYGSMLDLVAPGVNIYSTLPGGYGRKTGTSMSAPYVSGLAAVLWSLPGNQNARRVEQEIEQSAQDLGTLGRDDQYGYGLIRMDFALSTVLKFDETPTNPAVARVTHTRAPMVDIVMTATPAPTVMAIATTTCCPKATALPVTQKANLADDQQLDQPASFYIVPTGTATSLPLQQQDTVPTVPMSLWGGILLILIGSGLAYWNMRTRSHSD